MVAPPLFLFGEIVMKEFEDSIRTTETSGTCLYAAILLSNSINKFTNSEAIVCGGGPDEGAGIRDKNGGKKGHYWVEGKTESGVKFIADISSDQFDYPPVVVIHESQGRVRYFPGNQETIDQHVKEELEICMRQSNISLD